MKENHFKSKVYNHLTWRPAQRILLNALDDLTGIDMQLSRDTVSHNSAHTSQMVVIVSGRAVSSAVGGNLSSRQEVLSAFP